MTGLARNTAKLFENGGRLFLVALDHPQYFGPMEGLENPLELVRLLAPSRADGFIVNPGICRLLPEPGPIGKKIVLRASLGGSRFSDGASSHPAFLSAETALDAGADAVILMLVIGKNDPVSMENVARSIDRYHAFSIPVMVEVLAENFEKTNDTDLVKTGARIAAELGADVLKVFHTERFAEVIAGCPVPVLLAGGPKGKDITATAGDAAASGVRGFAFGRSIFQDSDPVALIGRLDRILRG